MLATEMYKIQDRNIPDIMSKLFRKRNVPYDTKSFPVFETRNIKTVHYGSETITHLGPNIWDIIL